MPNYDSMRKVEIDCATMSHLDLTERSLTGAFLFVAGDIDVGETVLITDIRNRHPKPTSETVSTVRPFDSHPANVSYATRNLRDT